MKIIVGKTDIKGDEKLSFFISIYVLASSLNIAVKTIFNIPQSTWPIVSLLFEGLILMSLLVAIPTLLFRKGKQLMISEGIFTLLYLFSILIGLVDISLLKSTAFWTLAICIPLGVAGIAINKKQTLFKYLKYISYIEYPVLCLALLSMKNTGTYSMSVSYALILPILFLLFDFFDNRKVLPLILAIFGSILIVVYGARGPIVCVLFYVFIKLFLISDRKRELRNTFIRLGLMVLILFIVINWTTILEYIDKYLRLYKINSYALSRLLNGQIIETAGRNQLWQYYFELLNKRPLLGYGLLGGWIGPGEGPHNMLLEFLLAFGYVIGGIICIYAILLLIKAIWQKNEEFSEGIKILAAYNFTMYFVSGDWLEKPIFFLFAYLIIYNQKK